jgi:hypothetical protein
MPVWLVKTTWTEDEIEAGKQWELRPTEQRELISQDR